MREYVVTVNDINSWDQGLWDELTKHNSTVGYIPIRPVSVLNERPFNDWSAHFALTDAEAKKLKLDPRIKNVELLAELRPGIEKRFNELREGVYDKSFTINNTMKNWGLIRGSYVQDPFNGQSSLQTQFDTYNLEGEGVDLVIVDSGVEAGHPEFAVNKDGTGGTRVVDFNWASLGVPGTLTSAQMNGYLGDADGHGSNCASIACGNTCGWASKAHIYSIRIFAGYSIRTGAYLPAQDSNIAFDLVRAFHLQKIAQGNTRPTVCTNSWGWRATYGGIVGTTWRGNYYPGQSGSQFGQVNYYHPYNIPYVDQSVDNAAAAGVIFTGAAGNYYHKIDVPGGIDYDNSWNYQNVETVYYHRGSSPTSAPSMINVGALDNSATEQKAVFSETGPRVDIYSPGVMIMGAYANKSYQTPAVADPRAPGYYLNKISGTSQATPNCAGVVCCLLGARPSATIAQVKAWLTEVSVKDSLVEGTATYSNTRNLQGGNNRILHRPLGKGNLRGWMSST